ncbi:MAG: type 12 methyltransferase [Parcubacteria group bacterium Gr01-1014_46]|nr:MAG: type 12 methyltransferase [Parcubacteria group bacterium Gr01-1014_46]
MEKYDKFDLQDNQYEEPYHHFVSMDGGVYKALSWGLGYFGYISRVMSYIDSTSSLKKVADVGCGDGKLILELSKIYPATNFYGYDLSTRGINFAKAYSYGSSNVEFYAEDFSNSRINTFDVITCIETMEHIPDEIIPGFVSMLREKISSNGKLIITVPSTVLPLNKKHYRHYDENVMSAQLSGKFKVEKFEWLHDGRGSWFLRFLLINRFYVLRFEPLRKLLVSLYKRFYLISDSKRGEHLLAICSPV